MDPVTTLIIVSAVLLLLFLFVILFIQILRLQRKAKLQTKIALMQAQPIPQKTKQVKNGDKKRN